MRESSRGLARGVTNTVNLFLEQPIGSATDLPQRKDKVGLNGKLVGKEGHFLLLVAVGCMHGFMGGQ